MGRFVIPEKRKRARRGFRKHDPRVHANEQFSKYVPSTPIGGGQVNHSRRKMVNWTLDKGGDQSEFKVLTAG
jgi:hypothetical protein